MRCKQTLVFSQHHVRNNMLHDTQMFNVSLQKRTHGWPETCLYMYILAHEMKTENYKKHKLKQERVEYEKSEKVLRFSRSSNNVKCIQCLNWRGWGQGWVLEDCP